MGRPLGSKNKKKKNSVKVQNPSGREYLLASRANPTTSSDDVSQSSKDPIQQKNESISREKAKVLPGVKAPKGMFEVQVVEGNEPNSWISKAIASYFGFETCGFRDNIKRWDFPHAIGNVRENHAVYRQYFYKQIMVDVFDQKTPVKEIQRIKAHMDKLGFSYTYVIGGETMDEKYLELVFKDRLVKTDSEILKKVVIPKNLAEAGYAGHSVEMR